MKIAILGWGSLIKEPGVLRIAGDWLTDGPTLWIEFSRISKGIKRAGCLTLVVDERCESQVTTLHVISEFTSLAPAIANLQEREGTAVDDIGFCEVDDAQFAPNALRRHPQSCERIRAWAVQKDFDAVIWTALGPNFKDTTGIPFSPAAALTYLNGLPAPTREKACKYIQDAPVQTMTPFRKEFMRQYPQGI